MVNKKMHSISPDPLKPVVEFFYHWEKTEPNAPFLHQPAAGQWRTYSYAEVGDMARRLVSALQAMGLKRGDHIGIVSKNCANWFIADIAMLIGGYVSVPLYPSLPKEQLAQVVELGDLKALFIGRLDSWGDKREAIPDSVQCIRFPQHPGDAVIDIGEDWDALIAAHQPYADSPVPELDDLWTIKFTSGTTGVPKGVMHSYRGVARLILDEYETDWIGLYAIDDPRLVSYLPLNHVAERIAIEMTAIVSAAEVFFTDTLETFAANVQHAKPTMFFAVPRIWTLLYQGVTAKIPEKRFNRLIRLPIIGKLLKKKILTQLGLENVQLALTGAAMTPNFVKSFFQKLDIRLMEVYGLTETMGAFSHGVDPNTPEDSCGQVMPSAEAKIDEESREILVKTPYIMLGYYNNPEKTAETFQDDWFKTGDRGAIDAAGNLKIIGRVKDIFKTAKGSYITPAPLEEFLLTNPLVDQVCVTGPTLAQPIALMNLSEQAAAKSSEEIATSIEATMQALNNTRASHEKISTCVLQKESWTVDNGLMTPTLKIKRSELDTRFGEQYQQWHDQGNRVVWA